MFIAPAEDAGYKARAAELKRVPYRMELTNTQEFAMFAFNSQFPFIVPQDVEKIDWDLVFLPTFKDKPKIGSQPQPIIMGVTQSSKNKEAVLEAIRYLTTPEIQLTYSKKGIMPVIDDAAVKQAYGSESAFSPAGVLLKSASVFRSGWLRSRRTCSFVKIRVKTT